MSFVVDEKLAWLKQMMDQAIKEARDIGDIVDGGQELVNGLCRKLAEVSLEAADLVGKLSVKVNIEAAADLSVGEYSTPAIEGKMDQAPEPGDQPQPEPAAGAVDPGTALQMVQEGEPGQEPPAQAAKTKKARSKKSTGGKVEDPANSSE